MGDGCVLGDFPVAVGPKDVLDDAVTNFRRDSVHCDAIFRFEANIIIGERDVMLKS